MVVAAFNQEKALVGAFSMIVQLLRLIVYSTSPEELLVKQHLQGGHPVHVDVVVVIDHVVHGSVEADVRLVKVLKEFRGSFFQHS